MSDNLECIQITGRVIPIYFQVFKKLTAAMNYSASEIIKPGHGIFFSKKE